ncbi:hypothetical protein ABZ897_27335 [Nonomuraea sp. NPDC046802]|uniref:hypothetical protein n=1 Tax=Nonomuraea sp. NPDC046802 TaxID=3154919 RepID=UPI0033F86EE2
MRVRPGLAGFAVSVWPLRLPFPGDALDKARALFGVALRAEQAKTGASAGELAERARSVMSHPLVLKALRHNG